MTKIDIYGQSTCAYCDRAVAYCTEHQLPFVYRDIANSTDRAEMFARNPQATTVPQIFIGTRRIGGFDDLRARPLSEIQQMIGE